MRVAIVRRAPQVTFSMDVYADELTHALGTVRPDWEIIEVSPTPWWAEGDSAWKSGTGFKKYYERFWNHPRNTVEIDADIFHVIDHTDGHIGYWLKKSRKPFVVTCHDLVQFVYPEILRDQSRFPFMSLAVWKYSVQGMKAADCVVAVSHNTKSDITRYLDVDTKAVEVVYNAVNPEFCLLPLDQRQALRVEYGSDYDICLLNVGSTHQRKNILTVLEVLKTLIEKGLSVCLWRTGGAFTAQQQQFIQDNNLNEAIRDFGKPSRLELIRIYNSADVLLAPSLYEGFGLTVLEGMACGLPVITSNTSSLPEVSGEAAILIDPLDVHQIAEAVIKLLSDSDSHQSLAKRGLQRAEKFTWKQTAEQVAQVYENILTAEIP